MSPRPRRMDDNRTREPQTRINEAIRVREVQLIDEAGENKGEMRIEDAQRYALERSLDLVEIAPQARPPVCRVMDYGKWKYEQNVKAKQARKHRSQIVIKEIKFRPKIGVADYTTKTNHVRRFLEADDKVKITIMFRGREVVHHELGRRILDRVAKDIADIGTVESSPNLEGRNMTMMVAPARKKEVPVEKPAEGDDVAIGAPAPAAATADDAAVAPAAKAPSLDEAPAKPKAPAKSKTPVKEAAPAAEQEPPATKPTAVAKSEAASAAK